VKKTSTLQAATRVDILSKTSLSLRIKSRVRDMNRHRSAHAIGFGQRAVHPSEPSLTSDQLFIRYTVYYNAIMTLLVGDYLPFIFRVTIYFMMYTVVVTNRIK